MNSRKEGGSSNRIWNLAALGIFVVAAVIAVVAWRRGSDNAGVRSERRETRVDSERAKPSAQPEEKDTYRPVRVGTRDRQLSASHPNGKLKTRYWVRRLDNGAHIKHGRYEYWNVDGTKLGDGEYKEDLRSGKWTYWNPTGRKSEQCEYRAGKRNGASRRWSEDGNLYETGSYVDEQRDGLWVWWYANGQKSAEERYKLGERHGWLVHYHQNGQISERVEWRNNKPRGKKTFFHENGNKAEEGAFVDGKAHGVWSQWDATGRRTGERVFVRGELKEK
jgi:antitoxin component YwqK of YwqJK toxin-antitoxin module